MAESRKEAGCKGIMFILLAVAYLGIYEAYGIESYVYFGCGITVLTGLLMLLSASFTD